MEIIRNSFTLGATRISKMFASGALKPPEFLLRSLPLFGEVYERRNHWTLLQKIRMDQQFRKLSCIDIIKDSFYSELDGIDLNKFATQFEDCEVLPSDQVWIVCMDASRTSNSDPRSPNDAERNIAIPKVEWNFRNSLPPDSIEIGSGRWWHMCKTGHLSGGTCRPLLSEEYINFRHYVNGYTMFSTWSGEMRTQLYEQVERHLIPPTKFPKNVAVTFRCMFNS